MNSRINLQQYLRNPQSREASAFFDGARAMISALQLAPPSEYASMLSTSNQQHIIALLVQSEEQQNARRRNDVQQLLKAYDVNLQDFLAFVFDLPKINLQGQAIDEDFVPLEDTMFHRLPGKTHDGWPHRKIQHMRSDQEITRNEYLMLDEKARDDYNYTRYFYLTYQGQPVYRVSSSDRYLMEELIRQSILLNNPAINRRYLTEIYYPDGTSDCGQLFDYRDIIINAINELHYPDHTASINPMLITQAKQGYITSIGQYWIANLQQVMKTFTRPHDLLKAFPEEIQMWGDIIKVCRTDNDTELAKLITDKDIANYQNVNGAYLSGAIRDSEGQWKIISENDAPTLQMQKDFFKHILIGTHLYKRLVFMLERLFLNQTDLEVADTHPGTLEALHELSDILLAKPDANAAL